MNAFLTWWSRATHAQKKELAAAVKSTVPSLHQAAHAYRTKGRASLSADLAQDIEAATGGAVPREEMCPACGRCDLARKAREG